MVALNCSQITGQVAVVIYKILSLPVFPVSFFLEDIGQ